MKERFLRKRFKYLEPAVRSVRITQNGDNRLNDFRGIVKVPET